jgi:hypothetical protein
MSEKMTCPGCQSHTSDVRRAYDEDEPCPHCALPASATDQVLAARRKAADADLTARYEELAVRVGRAESEAVRLRNVVDQFRDVLDEFDKQSQ